MRSEILLLGSLVAGAGVLWFGRKPKLALRGVNLAGAEFGTALPGVEGQDYVWPNLLEVDHFHGLGMNTVRLNFQWERLQPQAKGAFVEAYLGKLDVLVRGTTSRGLRVVLNPQNFARYYGKVLGSEVPTDVFVDLWSRLATRYKDNPLVVFGLMNEPHDIPTEQWVDVANAAIAAIRATGARNLISVPGNGWTGAHAWNESWYGTPNAVAMLKIRDALNNVVFEVHNYLDADASGAGKECVSPSIGSERMQAVTTWARKNKKRLLLAEFGAPDTPTCQKAVTELLRYCQANSDVIMGWLWWAAGPLWGDDYQLSIEPKDGRDRAQAGWLRPFL